MTTAFNVAVINGEASQVYPGTPVTIVSALTVKRSSSANAGLTGAGGIVWSGNGPTLGMLMRAGGDLGSRDRRCWRSDSRRPLLSRDYARYARDCAADSGRILCDGDRQSTQSDRAIDRDRRACLVINHPAAPNRRPGRRSKDRRGPVCDASARRAPTVRSEPWPFANRSLS